MYPGFVWVVDKADVAAKAIQPPFYPQVKAFVLILKTLQPVPLAILRGEGQHSILLFFVCLEEVAFMKDKAGIGNVSREKIVW